MRSDRICPQSPVVAQVIATAGRLAPHRSTDVREPGITGNPTRCCVGLVAGPLWAVLIGEGRAEVDGDRLPV